MSTTSFLRGRPVPMIGRGRRIRLRPRLLLALLLLAAILFGAWLWVRQSSLVAVRSVTVTGVSGASANSIRRALVSEAKTMTTLDLSTGKLRRAVGAYPDVKDIRVQTHFPHGLTITVYEDTPIALVTAGGHTTPVAGDGTLLPDVTAHGRLPEIPAPAAPGGAQLDGPIARAELAVLSAAPYQFLPKIRTIAHQSPHGMVVALRDGPAVYFGDTSQLAAKWRALVDVLADSGSAGAPYIDVSDPGRPVAGGGQGAAVLAEQSANAYAAVSGVTTTDPAASTTTPAYTATEPAATATTPVETTPAATATAPVTETEPTATAPAETPTTTTP